MLKLFLFFFTALGMFNTLYAEKIQHENTLYHGKGAKYVFLFIGDGMGYRHCIVTKKAFGDELWMNTLPVKALVKTSAYGGGITDSAAAATAFACGEKTKNSVLGLNHKGKSIESVAEMAKKLGWKVGIVSCVPLNHATPAAFYAHRRKRYMYDAIMQDLAVSNFDYFGGGSFIIQNKHQEVLKALKDNDYIMIKSPQKMPRLEANRKYIVHSKMPYVIDRNKNSGFNLADYTRLGIKHLYTGNGKTKGFFMMIEGGRIDWASHSNDGGAMIREVKNFDNAVKVALDFYKKHPQSTSIIVTADHETGGLHFSPNLRSVELLKQKHSYTVMSSRLNKYKKEKLPFERILLMLQKNYGIKKFSPEELKQLHANGIIFKGTKKAEDKIKILYSTYKPLLLCIQRIFNRRCGLKWSTNGHTDFPVQLSAIGVGAKIFDGYYGNDKIANKLKSLIRPAVEK